MPNASSIANARSRASRPERDSRLGNRRFEYAPSSITRPIASRATDRAVGGRAHPSRSPGAKRAPRAQAAPLIRFRPAGATSTRRTPPPVARTRTPRSSAVHDGARRPVGVLVVDRGRQHLQRLAAERPWSPRARGDSARTHRAIASGDRVQSIARSSGPIRGAAVAARSSCARGGSPSPGSIRSTPTSRSAPLCARRTPSEPASSSGRIGSSSWCEDRAGIEALVHLHHGHARHRVAGRDRALDRRRPAPARQQREVQIDRAERRHARAWGRRATRRTPRRRSRPGASRPGHRPPRRCGRRRPRAAAAPSRRAASATAVGRDLIATPGGLRRVGHHQRHLQIRLAGDRLERGHRPRIVAEEGDADGHGGRIVAPYGRRRPRGSTSPSSMRRSSASTALRPSSSSRSI